MKTTQLFRFDNTYDVYTAVYEQDLLSGELNGTFTFSETGLGLIIPGPVGTVYLNTYDTYPLRSAIRNVRDRNGNVVFAIDGDEYDMYVIDANPQYDAFGSIVGWRHSLQRTIPKSLTERLNLIKAVDPIP